MQRETSEELGLHNSEQMRNLLDHRIYQEEYKA